MRTGVLLIILFSYSTVAQLDQEIAICSLIYNIPRLSELNWSDDSCDNPCSFRGVTCENGVNVSKIILPNLSLSGSIPVQIAMLKTLIVLDLSNNSLEGVVPNKIYEMINLDELILSNNNFSGSVLSNTGSITKLYLDGNDFFGLLPIAYTSVNLSLNLEGNQDLYCDNLAILYKDSNDYYLEFCRKRAINDKTSANEKICELECSDEEKCVYVPGSGISNFKCLPKDQGTFKPVLHCVENNGNHLVGYFGYENTNEFEILPDDVRNFFVGNNYVVSNTLEKFHIGKWHLQFSVKFNNTFQWVLGDYYVEANDSPTLSCESEINFDIYILSHPPVLGIQIKPPTIVEDTLSFLTNNIKRLSSYDLNISLNLSRNVITEKTYKYYLKMAGVMSSDPATTGFFYSPAVLQPLNTLSNVVSSESPSYISVITKSFGFSSQLLNENTFGSGLQIDYALGIPQLYSSSKQINDTSNSLAILPPLYLIFLISFTLCIYIIK